MFFSHFWHHYHQNYHHNYHCNHHWYFFCHMRKTLFLTSKKEVQVARKRGRGNLGNFVLYFRMSKTTFCAYDRQNSDDDNDGCNDNYDGNFDDNDDKNDKITTY